VKAGVPRPHEATGLETSILAPNGRARILVVEDEMLVSMLIEEMLAELGYDVIGPAMSVADALKAIEKATELDAGLLDLELKGERSLAVADALMEKQVPFAFMSGHGAQAVAETRHAGAPVLSKPFSMTAFANLLNRLVPRE
jgi:DNA-binding NtrC family response regulator